MKSFRSAARHFAVVALMAAVAIGCAHSGASTDEIPEGMDSFTLQIDNDNFNDARVQVFWNGQSQNLGRVRGSTTEVFELPYRTNRIRLRIEFVQGGRRMDSNPIDVLPDQLIRYRIDP